MGLCTCRTMPTVMQAAMSRAQSAVGRVWRAEVELDEKTRVVRLRNGDVNRVLAPLWAKGPVYVKVLSVSEKQRKIGLSVNPTVTVVFSRSETECRGMTTTNYQKKAVAVADLNENQLSALGLCWNDGRYWTKEEERAALEMPDLEDEEQAEAEALEAAAAAEADAVAAAEAEASAAALDARRDAAWAVEASMRIEREAAAAADEARAALEAAAREEAAAAAAANSVAADASLARDIAEVDAATATREAHERLAYAGEAEETAEAAALAAVAATVAAGVAAREAGARAAPTPPEWTSAPTPLVATPAAAVREASPTWRVTPAVTRSVAKERLREARASRAAEDEAAAAKAAAALESASLVEEMVAAAASVACSMARAGLKKLLASGYGPDDLRAMAPGRRG